MIFHKSLIAFSLKKNVGKKREKIVDIQSALNVADFDGDKKVDFSEWRKELRKRGYQEAEITAVFNKYDTVYS